MTVKAIQQFQLRTVLRNEKMARETLKALKDSGYNGIELCGFMIRKVPYIVRILTFFAGMPIGRSGKLQFVLYVFASSMIF